MVFSSDCTIGEVGLNEIRLVPMSERRSPVNNFSSADLGRTAPGNRNSYAAPSISTNGFNNYSSRNGQSTTSHYSSTNSLNSMDSSQSRQNNTKPADQPVPPMRKKRAAPRPPSQRVIPEDSPLKQMNFHVSTPNLSQTQQSLSLPGNQTTPQKNNVAKRPISMFQEPESQSFTGSRNDLSPKGVSRTSSNASEMGPLYVPRRKKAAPAPPPRAMEIVTPQPAPRTVTPVPQERLENRGGFISIKYF